MNRLVRCLFIASLGLWLGARAHAAAPGSEASLSFCAAGSAVSALPFLAPQAAPKALPVFPRCGACSTSICVGLRANAACGLDHLGRQAYCKDLGFTCPADGSVQCSCTSGPPA